MIQASITHVYEQIQEVKAQIASKPSPNPDSAEGWYAMQELFMDSLTTIPPQTMEEMVLLADILYDVCREFIGEDDAHMVADEKRLTLLVLQLKQSLHQFAGQIGGKEF